MFSHITSGSAAAREEICAMARRWRAASLTARR
jgi:hypothetical protein